MVKECVEQGLCINTLPQKIPQLFGFSDLSYYCETCWIHCQQRPPEQLRWNREGRECKCKNCSRRSKKQKNEFRKWNREWFGNIHTKIKEKWDLF